MFPIYLNLKVMQFPVSLIAQRRRPSIVRAPQPYFGQGRRPDHHGGHRETTIFADKAVKPLGLFWQEHRGRLDFRHACSASMRLITLFCARLRLSDIETLFSLCLRAAGSKGQVWPPSSKSVSASVEADRRWLPRCGFLPALSVRALVAWTIAQFSIFRPSISSRSSP